MNEHEIHALLDTARFGDEISITRVNQDGSLAATVVGPALAAPDVDRAVAIDLLDGAPHVIRGRDDRLYGQIVLLEVRKSGGV